MAYRKSEHPRIVQIVQPRVLNFWDGSKMTPYHNKLLFGEFELGETNLHENVVPSEALLHI